QNGAYTVSVRACMSGGFSDADCGTFASRSFSMNATAPVGAPTVTAPTAGAAFTVSNVSLSWTAVSGTGNLPVFYEVELTNQPSGVPELQILLPDPTLSTVGRLHTG